MPKVPPPPVIEGTLKGPINAMGFGILVSVWSINIGGWLTPYYFTYIVCMVLAVECALWFLDKPKQDYEVYKPAEESRRQETPVATPGSEKSGGERSSKVFDDGTKAKKTGARSPVDSGEGKSEKSGKEPRFRFRKGKNTDQSPESPVP